MTTFAIALDARFAEQLRADLEHFARRAWHGGRRPQDAARITKTGGCGLVQDVRIDARDLRRDVGANAEQAAGHRIDDLERLQLEVAAAAGQQGIEMLDERRLHEAIATGREVVEQRAAQ
jgi:hypothetical protein